MSRSVLPMARAVIVKRGKFMAWHEFDPTNGYSFGWTHEPCEARIHKAQWNETLVELSLRSGGRIVRLADGQSLPDRLAPEPIHLTIGHAYRCKDGVTRWIVMVHKPGGRAVTWDTVPAGPDYFARGPFRERLIREAAGKAGRMGYVKFQQQAMEDITVAGKA